MRIFNFKHRAAAPLHRSRCHRLAIGISKVKPHRSSTFHVEFHGKSAILVLGIKVGSVAQIFDAFFIAGIQVAIASHAREAEEVLVFKITAVAPTEHLEGNEVLLPRFKVSRQVELGLKFAILAVTHIPAIHPQVDARCDRPEVGDDVFPLPRGRYRYRAAVRAYMVAIDRDQGGIILVIIRPRVLDIDIYGVAIPI